MMARGHQQLHAHDVDTAAKEGMMQHGHDMQNAPAVPVRWQLQMLSHQQGRKRQEVGAQLGQDQSGWEKGRGKGWGRGKTCRVWHQTARWLVLGLLQKLRHCPKQ